MLYIINENDSQNIGQNTGGWKTYMADCIIILILGAIVFFIIRGQLRRAGQAQNGGGCSGCSGCAGCSACGGHSTCAGADEKKRDKSKQR